MELLQDEAGPTLSKEGQRLLSTISKSANQMGKLIDVLLGFSRIGQSVMQKTDVHLDEMVRGIMGDFQAETNGRNIEWKIDALPAVHRGPRLAAAGAGQSDFQRVKFTGSRPKAKIEIGSTLIGG